MFVATPLLMRKRTWRFFVCSAGLSWASIAACGGLSQEPGPAGVEAGGGSGRQSTGNGAGAGSAPASAGTGGSSTTTGVPPVPSARRLPQKHRAVAASCDHERPPGNARPYNEYLACPQDGGTCPAVQDCETCRSGCVDYADGLGPRCVTTSGECLTDADCTAQDNGRCWDNRGTWFCTYDTCYSDATCTSGGPCACEGESGSAGNTCLPGNCRIDADCGAEGYCSPTFGGCGNYSGVIAYYCHTTADTCLDDGDCVDPTKGGAGYCMYSPEVGHWACGYGQCVG